jgi:membrane protein YdbS with pleckstrin-like domain
MDRQAWLYLSRLRQSGPPCGITSRCCGRARVASVFSFYLAVVGASRCPPQNVIRYVRHAMITLRCDRRFLRWRLVAQLLAILALCTLIAIASLIAAIATFLLTAPYPFASWWVRNRYTFTYGDGSLRTQKLFSKDLDVRTPAAQVQSVSAYEGILEALCGVGTVEISTASSDALRATYVWPAIRGHRQVAEILDCEAKASRRRT